MEIGYSLIYSNDDKDCPQEKVYAEDLLEKIKTVQFKMPYAGSDIHVLSYGLCKRIRVVKGASKTTENFLLIAISADGLARICEETNLPFIDEKVVSPDKKNNI
jgi:hypothetical protein